MMNYEPYSCPLRCIATAKSNTVNGGYCAGKRCAWWDDSGHQCAIMRLSDLDATLSDILTALAAQKEDPAQ